MNKKFDALNMLLRTFGLIGTIKFILKKILKLPQYSTMKDFKEIQHFFVNKKGLEIGGPSNFFRKNEFIPVYDIMNSLDGINFSTNTVWTDDINEEEGFIIDGASVGKQFILEGTDLSQISKNSYDFILSCNNIEHIANPLKAIEQWLSVLNKAGVLVIIAPRKESNFDHKRKIVDFEHLEADFKNGTEEDDLTHLDEILEFHDLKMDPAAGNWEKFKERSLKNFENRCLHHHVYDLNVLKEIFEYFNLTIIKGIQLQSDYVIIGKKLL